MIKFYRLGARRILAGQKKMSTILVTTVRIALRSGGMKSVDRKADCGNARPAPVSLWTVCGKAEDESG
jgi:hypothetical protein